MKYVRIGNANLSLVGASETDPYLARLGTDAEHIFDDLCGSLIKDRDAVVLDVGANIGVTAAILSQHVPQGLVYAFEPGLAVHGALVQNIQANSLANVRPLNCAVSETPGAVRFAEHFAYGHITTSQESPSVRSVSIDAFVEEHSLSRVDFIKVDVEGYEKGVLLGAENTIARFSPFVHMEFNCWCLTAYSKINPIEFAEWLLQRFRFAFIVDRKFPMLHLRQLANGDASSFVHDHMVPGVCVDDLVLTNNEQHLPLIADANAKAKANHRRQSLRGHHFKLRPALSSLRRLLKGLAGARS